MALMAFGTLGIRDLAVRIAEIELREIAVQVSF